MSCRHLHVGDACVMVCAPDATVRRRIVRCPTCGRRRRFVQEIFDEWYSPIWTCVGCGDSWSDGERLPRPFAPRWRDKATAKARAKWAAA